GIDRGENGLERRQVRVDVRDDRDLHRRNLPIAAVLGLFRAVELREVLDALLGLPLRVVVAHRVDELLHEARREVYPGDDDAGHLLVLDLVVDAREGDGELVVGVADVGEVGVDARHDLRREVDVQVAFGRAVFVLVHGGTLPAEAPGRRVYDPCMSASPVSELSAAVEKAVTAVGGDGVSIGLERPADPGHGDYATAIALQLAKPLRSAPRDIAGRIAAGLESEYIDSVEIAGPGFLNLRVSPSWYRHTVGRVLEQGTRYGAGAIAVPQRIQVEYVSGNPTGPVTVATARNAA